MHYEKSGNPWSLDNNDVFAICTDSDGTTWVGTSSGALTFAPEINGFKKFDKTSGAFVSDIMQDSEGYIWFTTYNRGVFRYDAKKDEILNFRHEPDNRYSLCYDRIISVYEDSAKRLWFGSEDGGFCRYNRIDGTFSSITADDGLPSNVIHSIIEDDDKHLWLSTNNGLVHFDPTGMKIIDIYNQFNGLPSRQFNYNSGYRTEDGTIYFGSINGFVCFNPEFFKTDSSRHSVIFTDFKILGSEDEDIVDSGHISETAIPYTSSVSLDYRHNSFSIGFSALDYSGKGNGKYAYRLEGAEKTWNYISDNIPTITYNRMMPGNYTLKIKYSPDGHTWDDNTSNLGIVIKPPFWKTKWASAGIIILTLLSIGAIIIYIMYRREKSLQDKLALQEQKQSEEIYKAKIDFFTNMAHEIRTPITLIKIPLDSMLKKPDMDKDEIQENLVTMERNANRLLVLVNQLLDFRKIESNAMSLILKKKNINKIVESAMTDFLATAEQKNIDMTLHCPEKPVMAMVDEEALMKICSNLLSNAIKYASSYIKIELSKNTEYDYFSISVHNDGEKIAENMRERIFEAFFQIKSNWQPSQPGSGIGLTLASSLTKLHNGNLFIDEKAEDTAFIVQIPLKTKDIAGENEKADMQEPQSDDVESEETAIHDEKVKKNFTVLIVEDNEELLHSLQLREYSQLLDFGFTRPPGMLLRYDSDNDKLFIMNIDKMLGELREAGFDLRQPLMLSGSGEYHFFAKHTGKKVLPHYPGITELPESYFREMKEKIAAFMKEAARKQYPPFVFNPVDEPATENRFWLKRLYALFRELGGRTVFTSAPPFVREEMDAEVDIYSDGSFRYPYEKAVSGDKKEYWAYPNNVAYQISDPEIMCRNGRMVYGFGFWKSGYHQLMPWVWRLPNSNGHFQGRGGNLQLPDGTVAPGLYWACFREGIYDLNYLYTLQCAVARREKNAIPGCRALIRRARALIQKTWDDIPVRADYSAGSVFPHEEYDARRAEFADLILRLIAYPEDAGNAEVPSVLADTRGKRNPERTFDESSLAVFPLTCWRAHEREASLVQEGNETHLRIQVDHSADGFSTPGTPPKYLCGWPRMIFDFPQKTDLNAYPYLAFELKVDSNRNGEANESWPMWIQAVAKGAIRTIGEITSLQPATWHTFVLPLEDARLREAVRIQIGISENQYSDRADLHFRFRNLRLLAFRTPAPLNLRYAGKIEKRTQFLSVDFELAGPREQCDEIVLALSDAQGRTLDRVSLAPAQYISGGLGLGKCNPGRHTLGIEILKNGRSVFRKSGTVDVIDVFCKGKQEK